MRNRKNRFFVSIFFSTLPYQEWFLKRGGEGPQMEAQSFTFHEADNYLREYTWPDEAWESITLDQTVVSSPITSNSQSIDYVSSFIFLRTLPRNDRPPSE